MRQFVLILCLGSAMVAAGCGGSSGAEGSVRELYDMSRAAEGLDSDLDKVSCSDSATPEPASTVTFYDCTLEYDTGGSDQWCVVEGSARSAPLPLPCTAVPAEYFGRP
jgi:hypothetical protein